MLAYPTYSNSYEKQPPQHTNLTHTHMPTHIHTKLIFSLLVNVGKYVGSVSNDNLDDNLDLNFSSNLNYFSRTKYTRLVVMRFCWMPGMFFR